jgi:hypothetical protein
MKFKKYSHKVFGWDMLGKDMVYSFQPKERAARQRRKSATAALGSE